MRIVAGKHRGRLLATFEGDDIRPTSDKGRLALFNMLNSRHAVVDAVVLDVFCGTGALALEALSQGAAKATLIDKDKRSLDLARKNAQTLKENCTFFLADSTVLPHRSGHEEAATLCFLDPPYRKGLMQPSLKSLVEKNWLAKDCVIVAEMEKEGATEGLDIVAEKIYGETRILIGTL